MRDLFFFLNKKAIRKVVSTLQSCLARWLFDVSFTICIIGFCCAGVIYLKNLVTQFWSEKEVENPADPVPFSIHEQDRKPIRDNIIEAIIHAPDPVRYTVLVEVSVGIGMVLLSCAQGEIHFRRTNSLGSTRMVLCFFPQLCCCSVLLVVYEVPALT